MWAYCFSFLNVAVIHRPYLMKQKERATAHSPYDHLSRVLCIFGLIVYDKFKAKTLRSPVLAISSSDASQIMPRPRKTQTFAGFPFLR